MSANQDWIGNTRSVFSSLGASNHSENNRANKDFYATDPHALEVFLETLKQDGIVLPHKICEPACGMGHLSKVLEKHGYEVDSYDLYDYGYGKTGIDFLTSDVKAECFLTNPPYKYALSFVKKSLENVSSNGYVVMFLKIQFLEGKERYKFFRKNPPKFVYVNSSRQNCARNADFKTHIRNSAICYAWFVWQKGFSGETIVRWIP
jgi:hypothetical protein